MVTKVKGGVLDESALSGKNMTGDIAFDTTTLKIDASNNRVGVGTASPTEKLSILGGHVSVGDSTGANGTEFLLEGYREVSGGSKYGNISIRSTYNTGSNASDMLFYTASGGTNTAERMRIDSSGNVGIGVSPSYKLDVQGAAGDVAIFRGDANNTIRAYLGSSYQIFQAYNGTNTNQFGYVGDAFYIQTAASERMRIDSSGNVGIGATSSLDNRLEVNGGDIRVRGTSTPTLKLNNGDQEVVGMRLQSGATGNLSFHTDKMVITSAGKFVVGDTTALNSAGALGSFVFSGGQGVFISTVSQSTGEVMGFVHQKTSVVGTIAINSSSTTYNTSSDGRLKEITGDAKGLEIINKLNPVAFNWKVDNKSDEGLIAQEVLDIVPNAVSQRENGYYQMDYSKLVTPLIKAIQELKAEIEELKENK